MAGILQNTLRGVELQYVSKYQRTQMMHERGRAVAGF